MFQVDSFKRPSPSPSRSSIRSDSKICRQPRVIQVNRDVATMVESERQDSDELRVPDWEPFTATSSTPHFRSRTFSDGFLPNNSQELLLAVDCDACLAFASRQRCANEHISQPDFDLVCNCNIRQYNYLNYQPDIADQRGQTLNIYDIEKLKRGRRVPISTHHSLDRKHIKRKSMGVSDYISKQLNSYDPTNTLVQKIKRNLSNLKKIGGEAISKKHQNVVQLTDLPSDSASSLKKLSSLSLVDKTHKARKSHSYIFSSNEYPNKTELNSTYTNISGNIDQCIGKTCNYNSERKAPQTFKMRSFDNKEESIRNASNCQRKFSTLDNRGRCRSIPRQLSCNDFVSEGMGKWNQEDNSEARLESRRNIEDTTAQTCLESELVTLDTSTRASVCRCTCEPNQDKFSIFYDYQVSNFHINNDAALLLSL